MAGDVSETLGYCLLPNSLPTVTFGPTSSLDSPFPLWVGRQWPHPFLDGALGATGLIHPKAWGPQPLTLSFWPQQPLSLQLLLFCCSQPF